MSAALHPNLRMEVPLAAAEGTVHPAGAAQPAPDRSRPGSAEQSASWDRSRASGHTPRMLDNGFVDDRAPVPGKRGRSH
jgi:hypothetical protein